MHSEAALGRPLKEDGQPDTDVIKKLFKRIDEDNNTFLSIRELTALIIGIKFDEIDLDRDDAVKKVMDEFDTSNDNHLSEEDFVRGISKWVEHAKHSVPQPTIDQNRLIHDFHQITKEEHDMLIDRSDEVVESINNPYWIYAKAISLLLLGAVIAAAFADPLVDAVTNFFNATSIPTFFISFIKMPLATNSSEAVSAIIFANRKKQRTTSLTFSDVVKCELLVVPARELSSEECPTWLSSSQSVVTPEGLIQLPLTVGDGKNQVTTMIDFLVVDCPVVYNAILGRPSLNALQAVVSTYHLLMKFVTEQGIRSVKGDQHEARQCYTIALRASHQMVTIASLDPREDYGERGCLMEDLALILLDDSDPFKTVQIGSPLKSPLRDKMISLLRMYADVFAWSHEDMPGINPKIIVHRLNVDPSHRPI
ncbi:uncharacterized protein LOC131247032 [Magnolia sinica]|uniref:uncharacterized protein LOC131247032 n=1 Tax=Magnolia sinica TaxID=86752 RepID=UPI00265AF6BF|nr:uncharacterized protein LOC131247032 [Magnolia sinica]